MSDADLWQAVERYLAARRTTPGEFQRRHRLDRSFFQRLQTGGVREDHPAVAKVRRIVAYGPDLRRRREALRISMRAIEEKIGINPSRLSRAERLLVELTLAEKRKIDAFVLEVEKTRDRETRAARRRKLAVLLRRSRCDSGLTQGALADALGCERKSIVRWEKDGSVPEGRLRLLQRILPALSLIDDENDTA